MATFTTISAYRFTPLSDLKALRERLLSFCKSLHLRGTILLSAEGINLFVSGSSPSIGELLHVVRQLPGLEGLEPKYSESSRQPFNRMLVRIKQEIIAFGVEGIDPAKHTSTKLPAPTLKQWLDEGRPVTLLDTRNDYEVKLGTFENARTLGIGHFRDFPEAVKQLEPELKERPLVMFCTGGIRCEKAGPFMEGIGFQQVFQLDGGILKYFEEVGGAHYEGECFVFDQRTSLDPSLHESGATQCFSCQTPLTLEEQEHPQYVVGQSCPYCHQSEEEALDSRLLRRQESLLKLTTPLPGSQRYDNYRPISVPASHDRATLMDLLIDIFPHVPKDEWLPRFEAKLFLDAHNQSVAATHRIRSGEIYRHAQPATIEPDVSNKVVFLYEDETMVVVNKPAPLPTHPSGRYNRNTLQHWMREVYHPQNPRPVHRLDSNTTGLTVWARTRHFAASLQEQFHDGSMRKRYLVRIVGHPQEDAFSCDIPIRAAPGRAGSRGTDAIAGLPSRTEFNVLDRSADGTSLLEARPITGRTNQIRVHLWELGFPVDGDPIYLAEKQIGDTQTLSIEEAPLCLHAWQLSFRHPITGESLTFEAPAPDWASFPGKTPLPD